MVSPSTNTRPATYYTLPQLFFHLWVIISVFLVVIFMNKFTERVGRVALEKPTQIRQRKLNFHAQSVKILSISSRTNSRGQKILYLKKKTSETFLFFLFVFTPHTSTRSLSTRLLQERIGKWEETSTDCKEKKTKQRNLDFFFAVN